MITKVHTAILAGIEALPIVVEANLQGGGAPEFFMVGLADKAVQESWTRVMAAIKNSEMRSPPGRIVINLAPSDIRKEGSSFDLPIALAVLAGAGAFPGSELEGVLVMGELGLDGQVRHVDGGVNAALAAHAQGFKRMILPASSAAEAAILPDLEVYGVSSLTEAVELLNGSLSVLPLDPGAASRPEVKHDVDYSDVKGQKHAVRALELAAAGGHNLLMTGPPGSGKTLLARRLPTILPPLTLDESIEVTRIYSAGGAKGDRRGLIWERPFRTPHHTASYAAVVGGGRVPRPGEVSFAHHGVLFLDEMPEYSRDVLEALRQPLEDGVVTISRVSSSMTFPASCMIVGAMNPCPCGFKGYPEAKCVGAAICERYEAKLSGPLLDRIDLHITVPRLTPEELARSRPGESSAAIRERVVRAREVQARRFGGHKVNAQMSPREIRDLVVLDEESTSFMQAAAARLNISARVYDRLLKVGRTLADLSGEDRVTRRHLAEAIQYRGTQK